MKAPVLLTALMLMTTINAGILQAPKVFTNTMVTEGLELKSQFENQIRKFTSPRRLLVMVNTDGKNKESYKAIIKDGRLIISAKDDSEEAEFRTFSYETSLPDDVQGKNLKLSFDDDILIVEL